MVLKKSRTLGVWQPDANIKWVDPKHVSWRDPADTWVLLHDSFHHSPRDSGTNEREWESLGVEMWLKGLGEDNPLFEDQLRSVAASVFGAIIEMPEDGTDSRFQECLTKPAATVLTVPAMWIERLGEAIRDEFEFTGYEAENMDEYIEHAAGWAWRGYLGAQQSYPDPYRTQSHIRSLEKVTKLCGELAKTGSLKQWTARWDDVRGVRASWQNTEGTWSGIRPT